MAKFKVVESKQFVKSYKKLSTKDKDLTDSVLEMFRNGETLPEKYKDHQLKGELKEFRECHVRGDLLLICRTSLKSFKRIINGSLFSLFLHFFALKLVKYVKYYSRFKTKIR